MKQYVYLGVFIFLVPVMFKVLQSSRLEEAFKPGSVWQIRFSYIFGSLILAMLATLAIERIFSLM